jgi:hypothetical protein
MRGPRSSYTLFARSRPAIVAHHLRAAPSTRGTKRGWRSVDQHLGRRGGRLQAHTRRVAPRGVDLVAEAVTQEVQQEFLLALQDPLLETLFTALLDALLTALLDESLSGCHDGVLRFRSDPTFKKRFQRRGFDVLAKFNFENIATTPAGWYRREPVADSSRSRQRTAGHAQASRRHYRAARPPWDVSRLGGTTTSETERRRQDSWAPCGAHLVCRFRACRQSTSCTRTRCA